MPTSPLFQDVVKQKNKLLTNYANRTVAAKPPVSLGAGSTTPARTEQQAAAPVQTQNLTPSAISQKPMLETILPDQDPDVDYYGDGTDGIAQLGQAATREEQIKAANRAEELRKQQAALNTNAQFDWGSMQGGGGFNGTGSVKGFDSEQMNNARIIAETGRKLGIDENGIRIAIMTAITESSLRNVNYGDAVGPDSRGLFQQRDNGAWGTLAQRMDPAGAATSFYKMYANGTKADPWAIAQGIQRSAFSDGSNYRANWGTANSIYNALYSGGQQGAVTPTQKSNGALSWINANNNKYHDYDGMYGAQCVDLFNFYASGFVGANLYMGQAPYAQDLWRVHDRSKFAQIGGNQLARMGDVAIWNNGFNGMGGHVAVVVGDNGNGTLRVLTANSTAAGPNGNSVIMNLSKNSLSGYLRPRKLM